MVHWESQLERDQIYLLEFDPDVLAYGEQVAPLIYELEGKRRRYTPDFLVQRTNGTSVIEVKPDEFASREKWQSKFTIAEAYYRSQGIKFIVATEKEIHVQPRLDNIRLILRFRNHEVDQDTAALLLGVIASAGGALSIRDLATETSRPHVHAETCSLIAMGSLEVDLEYPFTIDAPIWIRKGVEQ